MFKPAVGGLLMGAVAWWYPEVIDGGYVWIQTALEGKMLWQTMAALVLLKIVATSFAISSGGSGGVFGPSVFIGAMLGGAFGQLGHALFPQIVINPGAFVLVGMGAMTMRFFRETGPSVTGENSLVTKLPAVTRLRCGLLNLVRGYTREDRFRQRVT